MYAHQVIEDMLEIINMPVLAHHEGDIHTVKGLIKKLISVKKFHTEEINEMASVFNRPVGSRVYAENVEYLKLPFQSCWFEYFCNDKVENPKEKSSKRGMFVEEIEEGNDRAFLVTPLCFLDAEKHWFIPRITYLISIGKQILKNSLAQKILIFMAPEGIKDFVKTMVPKLNTEITPVFLSTILVFGKKSINSNVIFEDDHVRKLIDTIMYEDSKELVHLVNILTLLHCKNVTTKTIPAPEKLNKKRRKFNKQPIFSYKILIIKPGENKKIEYPENPTQNHQRIHLARGHFKSYTEKNPLFGQHTGMWWWQPHVRGQNREGKIVKDYKMVMNG